MLRGISWQELGGGGVAEISAGSKAQMRRASVKVPKESWWVKKIVRGWGWIPQGPPWDVEEFGLQPVYHGKQLAGVTLGGYFILFSFIEV